MGTPARKKLSVILIILIALSLISLITGLNIKTYERNVSIHKAESQIAAIYNICKMYGGRHGLREEWDFDVDELEENEYLSVDEAVRRNWLFTINGNETIFATPTQQNPKCQGYKLIYEITKGEFVLYKNGKEKKRKTKNI